MKIPESVRLAGTLTVAGLLSGLVIVGVHQWTQPRIRANKAEALREAVFQVLPGTAHMERRLWTGDALAPAAGDPSAGGESVYAGFDEAGRFVGWAIPSEGAGFQDTIRLLYGYVPERGEIVGMRVLESRETPGLGDRIIKDQAFVAEFEGLAVEPRVESVKGGGDGPNQVDAITGATISSEAVVEIINGGNDTWLPRLPAAAPVPIEAAPHPIEAAPGPKERAEPVAAAGDRPPGAPEGYR